MAPKKQSAKLSASDQAANYQRRARELSLKAERMELDQILNKFPHLATALLMEAKSLGYSMKVDMIHGEAPSRIRAAELAKKAAKASTHLAIADQGGDDYADPDDLVPTKYWTLGSLSVHLLSKKILASMEPVAMSMANLRSMSLRGLGDHGKAELMKLIEFMCGLHPDTPLTGAFRKWSTLVPLVMEKNIKNGRPARDMKLPPDWKEMGFFRLEVVDEGLAVHHNINKEQVIFETQCLDGAAKDYTLEMNWSESRACFFNSQSAKHGAQPMTVHCLFKPSSGDDSPAAKKARLAGGHDLGGSKPIPGKVAEVPKVLPAVAPAVAPGAASSAAGSGQPGARASAQETAAAQPKVVDEATMCPPRA
jgi:hypothetical protein